MDEPNSPLEPPTGKLGESEIQNLWNSSTLPSNFSFRLCGFQTTEDANAIGAAIASLLRLFGAVLNLERLDGVTVAYDYDAALKEFDKGIDGQDVTATNDTFARGVSMAVRVLREGQLKCHIVLAAGLMQHLRESSDTNYKLALGTLAHEAAHVHDLLIQDRAFPNVLLSYRSKFREVKLFEIAHACWDEYAACKLSADFQDEKQLESFEDTFCSCSEEVRERANEHIRQYRLHGDLNKLVPQVVAEYCAVFRYAGYLLGHLDGLGLSIEKDAPKAHELINRKKYLAPIFEELVTCLRSQWATYGQWSGLEVFDPLKNVADKLLRAGGIEIETLASGDPYVNVPCSPETIPAALNTYDGWKRGGEE
jgi:hypothetical protein